VLVLSAPKERARDRQAELQREAVWHDGKTELKHHRTPQQETQFLYDEKEGVITLRDKGVLRLNAKGSKMEEGDPLILYPCSAHMHELFKLRGNLIRVAANHDFCLNVEGGANKGNKIVTWTCAQDGKKQDHEDFIFDDVGRIRLKKKSDMCINAKEGISLGAELILWPCADEEQPNEVFELKHDMIRSSYKPEFHFNIKGGNLSHSSPLILWRCDAANHEKFEFTERGQVRAKLKPRMCLNAEGGLQPGNRIILWPCTTSGPVPDNEFFYYDKERLLIYSAVDPNLVMTARNVEGVEFALGDHIIIWPLKYKTEVTDEL